MTQLYEMFIVGEEFDRAPPSLAISSLARVLKALMLCDGKLIDYTLLGNLDEMKDKEIKVMYRIGLPIGKRELFETLSGFPCTQQEVAGAN